MPVTILSSTILPLNGGGTGTGSGVSGIPLAEKGAAGGVAAVDSSNKLSAVHWPAGLQAMLDEYLAGSLVTPTLFSVNNIPPGSWRPFNVNSPWNTPIPSTRSLHANSAAMVTWLINGGVPGPTDLKLINTLTGPENDYGKPTYYSTDSDPLFTLNIQQPWGYDAVPNGTQIRIPDAGKPAGGTDHHINVFDQKNNKIWSLFGVSSKPAGGGTLTCISAGACAIDGSGITPGGTGYAGGTAGSFNAMAGIIRAEELIAGEINHALFCITSYNKEEYVWPAGYHGATSASCPVPGGARFFLDYTITEINALPIASWLKTILRAMSRYGFIVGDTNGGNDAARWELQIESPYTYTCFGKASPLEAFAAANSIPYNSGGKQWRFPLNPNIAAGSTVVDWTRLKVVYPNAAMRDPALPPA